ncbi:MAG: hypothetical protein HKN16_01505 [Saprospiraceae bacterium]|nr:hypothetical protein [Saprospiraceae bacterium]
MRVVQIFVWSMVVIVLILINVDPSAQWTLTFLIIKSLIEFFLLGVGATQVLKITETKPEDFEHIISLKRASKRFQPLLWSGLVVTLADLVLIEHYRQLLSSDTIIAAVLFLYFVGQILRQNKPSIGLGSKALVFDDYFPKTWDWSTISKISLEEEKMVLDTQEGQETIPLGGVDQLDLNQTGVELAAQILDGRIHLVDDSSNFKSLLRSSSLKHGFALDFDQEAG